MAGIAKVHQYGIMCAPTPAQFAAIEALRSGEPHLQAMRAEYDRRRRYITDRFNEIGLATLRADGRLLLLPARDRCDRARRRRRSPSGCWTRSASASCPGIAFGPSGAGHVRVCYATAYEEIVEAMDRIERFVGRHRA